MAGAGYKLFNTGDVLTAAQVNTYLQEQAVMRFANSTARTTALSGVLAEGMVSYLDDTNAVEVYNGTSWVNVGNAGDITEVQAGTGISVASGTGPIPVVTNSMATEITAAGDIIVGTGSGTFDNLPIGTTGQVLTADTTVSPYKVKWASAAAAGFVGASVYKTAAQSISNNTNTALTFTNENFDTDGIHDNSSNTSRFTIPTGKGGKWLFIGAVSWSGNSTGYRQITIQKNGTVASEVYNLASVVGSVTTSQIITFIGSAVATDYFELFCKQNSGGSLNVDGDATFTNYTVFQCVYLGA